MYKIPAEAHIMPPKRVFHMYLSEGVDEESLFQLSVRSNHIWGETNMREPMPISSKLRMKYMLLPPDG